MTKNVRVARRGVQPRLVVVHTPPLDQDLGFPQRVDGLIVRAHQQCAVGALLATTLARLTQSSSCSSGEHNSV